MYMEIMDFHINLSYCNFYGVPTPSYEIEPAPLYLLLEGSTEWDQNVQSLYKHPEVGGRSHVNLEAQQDLTKWL